MPRKRREPYDETVTCPVCGTPFTRTMGLPGRVREYCGQSNDACRKLAGSLGTTQALYMRVTRYAQPGALKALRSKVWSIGNTRGFN